MIVRVPQIIVSNVLFLTLICFAVLFTGQSAIKHDHRLAILAEEAESSDGGWQVFKKNKDGLKGKYKIIGQVSLGLLVGAVLCFSDQVTVREKASPGTGIIVETAQDHTIAYFKDIKSAQTTIPFVKDNQFDYAWLSPF